MVGVLNYKMHNWWRCWWELTDLLKQDNWFTTLEHGQSSDLDRWSYKWVQSNGTIPRHNPANFHGWLTILTRCAERYSWFLPNARKKSIWWQGAKNPFSPEGIRLFGHKLWGLFRWLERFFRTTEARSHPILSNQEFATMTKGTTSFGKRHSKSHVTCRRCGRRSFHIQKKTCSSCGYPAAKMRRCKSPTKTL